MSSINENTTMKSKKKRSRDNDEEDLDSVMLKMNKIDINDHCEAITENSNLCKQQWEFTTRGDKKVDCKHYCKTHIDKWINSIFEDKYVLQLNVTEFKTKEDKDKWEDDNNYTPDSKKSIDEQNYGINEIIIDGKFENSCYDFLKGYKIKIKIIKKEKDSNELTYEIFLDFFGNDYDQYLNLNKNDFHKILNDIDLTKIELIGNNYENFDNYLDKKYELWFDYNYKIFINDRLSDNWEDRIREDRFEVENEENIFFGEEGPYFYKTIYKTQN